MRLSRYFLPILRETPKEAEIVSHRLMLRAGLIQQQAAGIYSWLPLGRLVLGKIEQIVREEQDRSGAIEVLMPTIQPADLWRESGRYDDYGKEMLRIQDRHERDMLYGPTNEEMITEIFRAYVSSYRAMPLNLYHIQWKFRDEVRPRFGVMRGREFLMKDAYSFDIDREAARHAYNRMFVAYLRTFDRLGMKAIPMRADSGPIGGDMSHEFIILASTGESEVYCSRDLLDLPIPPADIDFRGDLTPIVDAWTAHYAATDEKHDPAAFADLPDDKRITARGIEVGHIFYFGTKYSEPMGAKVAGPDGNEHFVHMGSYGVGVSRLVGAVIEASHDEAGIIWPDSVAPFDVGLINLKPGDAPTDTAAENLYYRLEKAGKSVLYDDLDQRAGAKFATMDLIGLPWQVIVGPKGVAAGEVEIKRRATGVRETLPIEAIANRILSG
jgi:prolyl-tRNA synthetase